MTKIGHNSAESIVFSIVTAVGLAGLTYLALDKLAPLEGLRPDQLTLVKLGVPIAVGAVGALVPQFLCNPAFNQLVFEN